MFEFFTSCEKDGRLIGEGWKNLTVTSETDMNATWKGLKRDGATEVHKRPCHCCGIKSDKLVLPNAEPCLHWCASASVTGTASVPPPNHATTTTT